MDNATVISNGEANSLNPFQEEAGNNDDDKNSAEVSVPRIDMSKHIDHGDKRDLFAPFYESFISIAEFLKKTKENKDELGEDIDENVLEGLCNLCEEFLKHMKNINDIGYVNVSEKEHALILEAYEQYARRCKDYNSVKPRVKQLEGEISNLLDLLFNNASEAVNTIFEADSFFGEHMESLKFKMEEKNQKVEFEKERLRKLELEKQVEEYDLSFEENRKENQILDEQIKNAQKEINKLNDKIEKYETYVKRKRKETDLDFSEASDCKERIAILQDNIKTVERNIKSTHLSPLRIVEQTPYSIIFEFQTPRQMMQFKVSNYESDNPVVEVKPYDENIMACINANVKNCKDLPEISYLIKEAIYVNFLDI